MLGPSHGATHLTVSIVELAPGAAIVGHLHAFEESFFVLDGDAIIDIGGTSYSLHEHDFGFVPVAVGHAWSNPGPTPARWLRVHSPQPRPIAGDRKSTRLKLQSLMRISYAVFCLKKKK